MLVAEILKQKGGDVFSIAPELTLAEVCAELAAHRVGALMVCAGDQVVGVISERDVVRAIARGGGDTLSQPVSAHMSGDVVFAGPADTVAGLMARMTDRRIRHLPVLANGKLTGVVSIGDVVKCQIDEATHEAESLRTYIAAG